MLPRSGFRYPVTMLMNVVLPAPLVPIRPTTESFSMAAHTSAAAVTAPKALHNPCASRMAGTFAHLGCHGPEPFRQKEDHDQQRDAEGQLPGVRREVVGHGVDRAVDQRADEGRNDIAGAGEDRNEDEFTRGGPVRHVRIDVAYRRGGERTADSRQRGGD